MKQRLAVSFLLGLLFAGCASIAHLPTEAMQVKQRRVNRVDLAYVEEGKGETVVFVHATDGDWRDWEGLRPLVAEKYHFVSLRLRYH
jgi:hypothetical protein